MRYPGNLPAPAFLLEGWLFSRCADAGAAPPAGFNDGCGVPEVAAQTTISLSGKYRGSWWRKMAEEGSISQSWMMTGPFCDSLATIFELEGFTVQTYADSDRFAMRNAFGPIAWFWTSICLGALGLRSSRQSVAPIIQHRS
jgi:hypothetical protein